MSLCKFKSKAYADVIMLSDHAKKIFDIAGHSLPDQGAIEPANMAGFRAKLIAAINTERMSREENETINEETQEVMAQKANHVSLEQRAFPLLKMLDASEKANQPIHWGF